MAVRVGTDVIEIERIRRALGRPGFRDRCFTADEQAYCESRRNPAESYAARFCGKEAVGKALGCGVLFTWKEIEIVGPPKPGVTLTGKTLRFAERVTRSAKRRVFPVSVTPGFGGPTISISFHVKRTPHPSAFPTASLPQKRAAYDSAGLRLDSQ